MASIPRANAPISNSDGSPTREWYNYLRANLSPSDLTTVDGEITVIAEKLGSPDGTVRNIPPISAGGTIVAQQSVAAVGAFPGAVILNLVNDQASPGNTYFYGTSPTGSKGWVSLTTALGQASIGNLGDVDTTTTAPTDGQVLTWVNADSKWKPRTPTGGGLPPGGTIGQVLTKLSSTDGDADWQDQSGGGIHIDDRVATYAALPSPPPAGMTTYLVDADGLVYVWDGSAWPANGAGVRIKDTWSTLTLADFTLSQQGAGGTATISGSDIVLTPNTSNTGSVALRIDTPVRGLSVRAKLSAPVTWKYLDLSIGSGAVVGSDAPTNWWHTVLAGGVSGLQNNTAAQMYALWSAGAAFDVITSGPFSSVTANYHDYALKISDRVAIYSIDGKAVLGMPVSVDSLPSALIAQGYYKPNNWGGSANISRVQILRG